MNYQKIYDQFIQDRIGKQVSAIANGYIEEHHIVPRSLGGTDKKSNLVALTAEDHLFAHALLAKIHGGKLWIAFFLMLNSPSQGTRSSKKFRALYSIARVKVSIQQSEFFTSLWQDDEYRNRLNKSRREFFESLTEEQRVERVNNSLQSPKARENKAIALRKPEVRLNMSNAQKGKKHSDGHKKAIGDGVRGKKKPDHMRENLSKSKTGVPQPLNAQRNIERGLASKFLSIPYNKCGWTERMLYSHFMGLGHF
jgi:hypothetical protein